MSVKKRPGDLAPFLAPQPDDPYEFLQGVLLAISPTAGTNTVALAGGLTQSDLVVIGDPDELLAGEPVMVLRIRTRFFILGPMRNAAPAGRGFARVASNSNSTTFASGTEGIVLTLPSTEYPANRAYGVQMHGGAQAGGVNIPIQFRLRKTNLAGATLGEYYRVHAGAGSVPYLADGTVVIKVGASPVTAVMVLTIFGTGGTATHYANADSARWLQVNDLGPASLYPDATTLT